VEHLQVEAGTVKIKSDMTPKLADHGVQCVFVGYAIGRSGNTYHMWDPSTRHVHVSRDVIWLHQMYYEPRDGGADKILRFKLKRVKTVTAQKALLKKSSESTNDSTESSANESSESADESADSADESSESGADDHSKSLSASSSQASMEQPVATHTT
jgi:hypothetical protein